MSMQTKNIRRWGSLIPILLAFQGCIPEETPMAPESKKSGIAESNMQTTTAATPPTSFIGWNRVSGTSLDVAVGLGRMYRIKDDGSLQYMQWDNNTSAFLPYWIDIANLPSGVIPKRVAAATDGVNEWLAIIGTNGRVYSYTSTGWIDLGGTNGRDFAISTDGTIYYIGGPNYQVYKRTGSSWTPFAGGNFCSMTVLGGNTPVGVGCSGQVYWYTSSSSAWEKYAGATTNYVNDICGAYSNPFTDAKQAPAMVVSISSNSSSISYSKIIDPSTWNQISGVGSSVNASKRIACGGGKGFMINGQNYNSIVFKTDNSGTTDWSFWYL